MQCPNCKLITPETAQRCDCGYDFQSRPQKASYIPQPPAGSSLKRQAYIGIGGFFATRIGLLPYVLTSGENTIIISTVFVIGVALLLWGCIALALLKGYSWPTGLLGALGCLGLTILLVLKDKSDDWRPKKLTPLP